jgi:hypothetical protein
MTAATPEARARARWRASEDRLYPMLVADPASYERALAYVRAVVGELRRRGDDVSVLLAAEAGAGEVLASACPEGVPLPADLLVGVACAIRDREISAAAERRRVDRAVAQAREAGRGWAVLRGPEQPGELTEGSASVLHVASGTVLTATVDPWSGGPRYRLQIAHPEGAATSHYFSDRAEWLAAHQRSRAELEDAHPGPSPMGPT